MRGAAASITAVRHWESVELPLCGQSLTVPPHAKLLVAKPPLDDPYQARAESAEVPPTHPLGQRLAEEDLADAAQVVSGADNDMFPYTGSSKIIWEREGSNNPQERLDRGVPRGSKAGGMFPGRGVLRRGGAG